MSYIRCNYDFYDYSVLNDIKTIKPNGKSQKTTYNDVVMMLDTETSKKIPEDGHPNHIVAFSISCRYKHENLYTLWGHKPSECIECLKRIIAAMPGAKTIIYVHNLAYDYVFLRKFFFKSFGRPVKVLNTKSHYPIYIEFQNGLIFRDSLILSQKSLERWAIDLDVPHKKAVGKWDYDKIRNQNGYHFSKNELDYIENDTLAGVECIDTLKTMLHHYIYSMPFTATGIVREDARKIGKENRAHDKYVRIAPDYDVYLLMEQCFHGGYTHGNRYLINEVLEGEIQCYDFTSSYPFVILSEKFPVCKFMPFRNCSIDDLCDMSDRYAFITRLFLYKPCLKDKHTPMPALQASKCIKSINSIIDNGRILASGFVEIIVDEQTLLLIREQYDYEKHICADVYYSRKDYLPRWFTDYVFELFKKKSTLKGVDALNYMLSKSKLNSCYGMCVQKIIQDDIIEDYDTGDYITTSKYNSAEYDKCIKNHNKFLPYQWGVWVTAYAMRNLFKLGKMCETWIYSDTDSVYGMGWDTQKIEEYNRECLGKLSARGYGAVECNGKQYILGKAELDGTYSQFKVLGAKRYCVRADDGLHITVAGVPKRGAVALNDSIDNFQKGFIFKGTVTGKKQHTYIYVDDIYIDEAGNETGDSIDLSPCDYLLDDINLNDFDKLFEEVIQPYVYDESEILSF